MSSENFKAQIEKKLKPYGPDMLELAQREIDLLVCAGIDSYNQMISVLENPRVKTEVRLAACWMLGRWKGHKAVPALLKAFKSSSHRLIWESAKSLGLIRSKIAFLPLVQAVAKSRSLERRIAAVYALGLLRDGRAAEYLVKVLENHKEASRLRGQAAESLAYLGNQQVVSSLVKTLRDRSVEVRFWSAFALGHLGDDRCLPELERLAATDKEVLPGWWEVGKEASEAIAQIRATKRNTAR
jgi:HEAT repeat protein